MGGTIADPPKASIGQRYDQHDVPGRPTIQIPRWIQLVGLPVLLLLAWALAGTLGHAIFLFLTASVIAFLLNPLVRALQRLRIRRGLAVAVVFLSFAAAMILALVALGTVVVEQTRSAADRVDAYLTDERGRSGDRARARRRPLSRPGSHATASTSRSASRRRLDRRTSNEISD